MKTDKTGKDKQPTKATGNKNQLEACVWILQAPERVETDAFFQQRHLHSPDNDNKLER